MSKDAQKNKHLVEALFTILAATVITLLFFSYEIVKGWKIYERIVNDASFYHGLYPYNFQLGRMMGEGFFPLWLSRMALGMPALGLWGPASLYPLTLIFLPFDFWDISNAFFLLRVWLMLITAYLLARGSFSLSIPASWLTAVTFAFSGYTIERLQMWEAGTFWLIPLFAYCVDMAIKNPCWKWLFAGGLVGALAIYSGHPPQAFYVFFFGFSLWVFRLLTNMSDFKDGLYHPKISHKSFLERLGKPFFQKRFSQIASASLGLLTIVALSILLSSAQVLPTAEILKTYWHHHPVSEATFGYPVRGFFSIILPWLAGSQKDNPLTALLMRYMGLIPVTFAVFGFLKIKQLKRDATFPALMTLLMLGVCYDLPIFRIWGHLPGFNRLANFVSMLPSLALCIGLLAGESLDYVVKNEEKRAEFSRYLIGWFLFLIVVFIYGFWLVKFLAGIKTISGLLANYETLKKDWLLQISTATILLLALVLLNVKLKKGKYLALLGWLVVTLAGLGLFFDRYHFNYQSYHAIEQTKRSETTRKLKQLLQSEEAPVRMTSDFLPAYMSWLIDAHDVRLFSMIFPLRYIYLIGNLLELSDYTNMENYYQYLKNSALPFPPEKMKTPIGKLLGVKYALVKPSSNIEEMEIVYSTDEATIIKNGDVSPICFLARGVKVFQRATDVLDFMAKDSTSTKLAIFASEDYPLTAPWQGMETVQVDGEASCKILRYDDQIALFETNTNQQTFAIITDLYHPGWKATVNGSEEKVLIADYLLKAVKVPAGKSRLELRYEPLSFKVGLWATVASFLFSCAVLVVNLHVKRKIKE